MSLLLQGKRAFISGGSRGLGRSLCQVFAREGADVAFNYNSNDEAAAETIALIEAEGRKALSFKVSVCDKDGMKNTCKAMVEAWGGIDVLINNAAVNKADTFVTTSEKAWLDIVNINVNGLYYVTKPIIKQMMRQRSGSVLNISSIGGIRSVPTSVHYATTKAAVVGFTKCLSREVSGFNITVNAVAAGIFDTSLGHSLPDVMKEVYMNWCAKKRFGRPEELAELAAFLVSDRNSYMVGEVITVDGGAVT
jgi:3-oxoacyl-[acyl-carrier protein] reductase